MLSGVIFDMDGVVADTHPAHIRVWKKFLASTGRRIIRTDLDVVREGRRKEEILRHFLGELSDGEVQALGVEKDRMFEEELPGIQTVVGVRELLGELRQAGIPAALASSGGGGRIRRLLHSLGISDYFAAVATGDEVAMGKPHPGIFYLAADRLKIPAPRLIVFEDAIAGVQGAIAAGMRCFGIADAGRAHALQSAGAECVFPDFGPVSLRRLRTLFSESPRPE